MKPRTIGVFEAKTRLSELLERVKQGQVYVISKHGRPVAELRRVVETAALTFGCDAGRIAMRDDFDEPVPGMQEYTE